MPSTIGRLSALTSRTSRVTQARPVAELDARRILPLGAVEVARQRNIRVAGLRGGRQSSSAAVSATFRSAPTGRRRPPQRTNWRRSPEAGARDRPAGRDGRRPAHRLAPPRAVVAAQGLVKHLAHAVQTLKLIAVDTIGILDHAGDGECVMGRELRKEMRTRRKQLLRAGGVSRDRSSPCG